MPDPGSPTDPVAWLAHGQALEARQTPDALAEAVRSYEVAITLLRPAVASGAAAPHALAVAWMNRGNALHQLGTPSDLAAAVAAYDETIALLRPALSDDLAARNTLGAAWMNRGLAAHRQAAPAAILDAVRAHAEAITVLSSLPLAENPIFRRNLAASLLNQANALLDTGDSEVLEAALANARAALALAAPTETTALESADLAFKARRVLCDALGHLLTLHESAHLPLAPLTTEASDTVDAGLTLARHWETKNVPHFRPLAIRLFRFGTQLYRFNQPHFLAEFILENLDPKISAGALPADGEFLTIATEAITRSLDTMRHQPGLIFDHPDNDRRVQTWRALKSAEARLAELHPQPT